MPAALGATPVIGTGASAAGAGAVPVNIGAAVVDWVRAGAVTAAVALVVAVDEEFGAATKDEGSAPQAANNTTAVASPAQQLPTPRRTTPR